MILKAVDTLGGACATHPSGTVPADWSDRCSLVNSFDDMSFVLSVTNEGNTAFTNMEFVDVLPHNGDNAEPASGTNAQGGSTPTLGDGLVDHGVALTAAKLPDSKGDGVPDVLQVNANELKILPNLKRAVKAGLDHTGPALVEIISDAELV